MLYVALARCAGLKAYDVNVEEDVVGGKIPHDCAAVFFGSKVMLVDPTYRWYGVPHHKFTVLNDVQAIALYMGQLPCGECVEIAHKLAPDILLVQLNFLEKMAGQYRLNDMRQVLPEIKKLDANGAMGDYAEARVALLKVIPDAAIILLLKAIGLTPGISTFYGSLADAYAQEGRFQEARESLRNELNCPMTEAEAEIPRNLITNTNALAAMGAFDHGIGMMNKGDWTAAAKSFDEVIVISPNDAVTYFYRGHAKQSEGDLPGARADYDKAIELNPELKQYVVAQVHLLDVASHVDPKTGK